MSCNNKEEYSIPTTYHYRQVSTKCGNTKYDGSRAICDECRNNSDKMREIKEIEENLDADNAWLRSAGWGEI
tara:strand:+ start:579 stop:794 length:216 start_codon:yes stop_codon:yes gene_type:complete